MFESHLALLGAWFVPKLCSPIIWTLKETVFVGLGLAFFRLRLG